jgi:hypothetical protein
MWVGIIESEFFSQRPLPHFVCSGVFERHPGFKLVVTEASGGSWVNAQCKAMDFRFDEARNADQYPTLMVAVAADAARALTKRPSEYVHSNVYIGNPIDFRGAVSAGVQNVMFGIDLPHSEGLSPYTLEAMQIAMWNVPEPDVRRLTSLTAAECYGFDLDALQPIADQIGYTPAQIATEPDWDSMPRYPDDTLCPHFLRPGQHKVWDDSSM